MANQSTLRPVVGDHKSGSDIAVTSKRRRGSEDDTGFHSKRSKLPEPEVEAATPAQFAEDDQASEQDSFDSPAAAVNGKEENNGPMDYCPKHLPPNPPTEIYFPSQPQSEAKQRPTVWANRRQALCESVPYFRSLQASVHSNELIAKGVLIDKECRAHDIFRAQVIITTV